MSNALSKNNLNIIDKIITTGKKSSPLLEKFIRKFYSQAPEEYLSAIPVEYLYAAASEKFDFVNNSDTSAKVRVFNPTIEESGWMSERTIIELCMEDMPFILDSITAELTRQDYIIYEVIHPILRLKRDKTGEIAEIFDRDTEGCKRESIMQFQITHLVTEELLDKLKADIENVLHFVTVAVRDWSDMREKAIGIVESFSEGSPFSNDDEIYEIKNFLNWAINDNFIFLGYEEYKYCNKKGKNLPNAVENTALGIFTADSHIAKPLGLVALPPESFDNIDSPDVIEITKSGRRSLIHRSVHMDYIGVKSFDKDGNVIGEHRLLGLFTSSAYYQSALLIPIIRRKIEAVVQKANFRPKSYMLKALLTVLESYPRDELLQISEDDLFRISMGIVELLERPRTKLFVRKDRFSRFVSCIVFLPRDRFTTMLRKRIQKLLEESFQGTMTDYYTQVTESPLARVLVLIKVNPESPVDYDVAAIEKKLVSSTNSWIAGLRSSLSANLGERKGEHIFLEYVDAFPESFKSSYDSTEAYRDIAKMEEACKSGDMALDLYRCKEDQIGLYNLKLYHPGKQITLSEIMPILENMGFNALSEQTFFIKPKSSLNGIWQHHFQLELNCTPESCSTNANDLSKEIKAEFEEALLKIWNGDLEDDILNRLVLSGGMKWRNIALLRGYSKYIIQTAFPYSHEFISNVASQHPAIVGKIRDLFYSRFEPSIAEKKRKKLAEKISDEINNKLASVTNITEDLVIRQFVDTVAATLRTNYFQKDSDGNYKPYISFKFDSAKVPNLPLPRPKYEIFVYSRNVEGVHLRGGKVARGGLRWSDRHEDFRTEVLGLVKAQMVKNAVIVPVGSKGCFVVKHPVIGDRNEVILQGQDCYKEYLSGLLDITDNIVNGEIIPPTDVVRHDEDDPYLVVAADKGTATFSDIANSVSEKYNFWLGDAFASGGSVGYDHKKMGITARGAWVSVERHFLEMGLDVQKDDFTVVGIGDMSGDVFGNGMLLSNHINLVGAFNHLHIFIDPNPDPAASFKERKRLFKKDRSSWIDYNQELISSGGGIFERSAKIIPISKEMKVLFDITEDSLSPDALMKYMLISEVDLLWNGGIGTYVKAESESNDDAGDKANDALRINGKDLRCKVIGEGGNLGFTQRGRIEYALNGGRVNTDSIDNSAGVDCSDHEVNIKIALGKALEQGKITLEERNVILAEMTDDVAMLVLKDNYLQTQAITITELHGNKLLEQKSRVIALLENEGLLNAKVEFLPDNETLSIRQAKGQGFTRPELSVLLSYSKMSIYDDLITSNLPDDPYFAKDLASYFPEKMRERFADEISSHALRREIIATSVSNSIVNRIGSTFFFRIKEDTGMKGCDVARGYAITRDAFGLREIWDEINSLSKKISAEAQIQLYFDVGGLIERATSWFLRNADHPINVSEIVQSFTPGIRELSEYLEKIASPVMRSIADERFDSYVKLGVPDKLARKVANLRILSSACDIAKVAEDSGAAVTLVGEIYYKLGTDLNLEWLRISARNQLSDSHWQRLAIQTLTEMLFDQQMRLAANVVSVIGKGKDAAKSIQRWNDANKKQLTRYHNFITDLQKQETIDQAMLTVAIQRVEALCGG